MRILLIEDNVRLVQTLMQSLRALGMEVEAAHDGAAGNELLQRREYDAVVLDLALPKLDGMGLLQLLRARGDRVPVLVLTASGDTIDRVRGLNAGADDYLAKPFELAELEARLRALHRRHLGATHATLQVAQLRYDTVSRTFTIGEERLALPPRELALLEALVEKHGQPVSKPQLADRLRSTEEALSDDALEVYIHRLRRRLEGSGARIVTLRGLGYLLEAQAPAPSAP